jgi:ring-1,2-phenylacetyl-CoA epoxidase subunit PaaD
MNKKEILSILAEVVDPEIPVLSIIDLGILRNVDIADNKISIQITPTYSGCPAMETIKDDIISVLSKYGMNNVEVKQVLSPAWTSDWMLEPAKKKIVEYGIAAPMASHQCKEDGMGTPLECPFCRSKNLQMISRFGSTACKALFRCLDCLEPFDYFKCH